MTWLYVAAGGAAGAIARYGVGRWVQMRVGDGFPWGTLIVNVLGSLLIGLAVRYFQSADPGPEMRALITVGLLGGFTTFSTFSYETVMLLDDGAVGRAALYSIGSLLAGVGAAWAGIVVGGQLFRIGIG